MNTTEKRPSSPRHWHGLRLCRQDHGRDEPLPDEWLACPTCSKNGLDREEGVLVCARCGWRDPDAKGSS